MKHIRHPVPGNLNIYVTNKTNRKNEIYVRLRGDKLQESDIYRRFLNQPSAEIAARGEGRIKVAQNHEEESRKRQVFSYTTQGGFTFLPHGEATPFAVENSDRLMYISVYDGSKNWCCDMPVNPQQYGCITIKEDDASRISAFPSNPEPDWLQISKQNPAFPSNAVKVYQRSDREVVYFAKVNWKSDLVSSTVLQLKTGIQGGKFLTGVWREDGKLLGEGKLCLEIGRFCTLDLLLANNYEWVKAQRGNIMPPNAVKATIVPGARADVQYVGRVGGKNVCAVSITDGMIGYFTDINASKTTSGDILLLTSDPSVELPC